MQGNNNKQVNFNIKPDDLDTLVCSQCKGEVFIQVFTIKHASPLISPTGKDHNFLTPVGFTCQTCGAMNKGEIKKQEKKEEAKVTLN